MHYYIVLSALIAIFVADLSVQDAAIQCPNLRLASPFDLKQFLGTWYELARFHKRDPDLGSSGLSIRPRLSACVRLVFSQTDDGKLRVERTGLEKDNKTVTQVGTADQGEAEHARFYFTYPDNSEEDLGVVEVDYQEHALLYGCYLTRTGHVKQDAWILSRKPKLANMTVGILQGSLSSKKVDVSRFKSVSHEEFCTQAVPDNGTIFYGDEFKN